MTAILERPVASMAESSVSPVRPDRSMRSWPLVLLAVPATVAVWSGWVRLGQMTGFGLVRPLPGLLNSLQLNTAITLPIGVEAYGVYALKAWIGSDRQTSRRTKRFARWSAIGSLLLGMAGQVAYHLLSEARVSQAPWGITTGVACLPVLLLGMAAALTHMIRSDAERSSEDGLQSCAVDDGTTTSRDTRGARGGEDHQGIDRLDAARLVAVRLAATGTRVSRRNLRTAGLHGSNAELGALAKAVSMQTPSATAARGERAESGWLLEPVGSSSSNTAKIAS